MASEKKMEYKWYVVRGISGQEKKVKTYIENELLKAGLSEYVPEVLIPMEKVYQIKNGKKTSKERNLFPGYILIQANLTGEVPSIITGINGVVGFLGPKDMPTPLRQSEVNRMLGTVDEQTERGETMLEPFIVGETVKVNDGPFSGFSGVIEEVHEEKKKLKVMVKIFGRKTPLELNYVQVEKE
ncbi:MAG: transcription termination/antitermination protein NusG [Bacteroidota bacterium]|nr:transcription termination/antitermination protein NusG [Bacteroidota bacterium]MDX5430737.1 transcription termination/antitermination protein NusG [Bacteroidota bacterium]MDX5469484.1 transcription termination/antitermination protein NusG [Bacteroidota bacterium]